MPRLIRNPFSLRQCKCLFVSVLLVCAVMVLVALKFHPELVKAPFHLDASLNREQRENSDQQLSADAGEAEWTESVRFLPHTDPPVTRPPGAEQSIIKGYDEALDTNKNLESIINAGPIYYHNKVPSYVPDGSAAIRGELSDSIVPKLLFNLLCNLYR